MFAYESHTIINASPPLTVISYVFLKNCKKRHTKKDKTLNSLFIIIYHNLFFISLRIEFIEIYQKLEKLLLEENLTVIYDVNNIPRYYL